MSGKAAFIDGCQEISRRAETFLIFDKPAYVNLANRKPMGSGMLYF